MALEDGYNEQYEEYEQYEQSYDGIDPNTGLPADGNKVKSKLGGSSKMTIKPEMQMEPAVTIHDLAEDCLDSMESTPTHRRTGEGGQVTRMTKADILGSALSVPTCPRTGPSVVSHVQGKHLEGFGGYVCKICVGTAARTAASRSTCPGSTTSVWPRGTT